MTGCRLECGTTRDIVSDFFSRQNLESFDIQRITWLPTLNCCKVINCVDYRLQNQCCLVFTLRIILSWWTKNISNRSLKLPKIGIRTPLKLMSTSGFVRNTKRVIDHLSKQSNVQKLVISNKLRMIRSALIEAENWNLHISRNSVSVSGFPATSEYKVSIARFFLCLAFLWIHWKHGNRSLITITSQNLLTSKIDNHEEWASNRSHFRAAYGVWWKLVTNCGRDDIVRHRADDKRNRSLSISKLWLLFPVSMTTKNKASIVLFCSLAVLDPRVGHTMDVLSPFIPVLCHSDWLFHGESCPCLDVVHPGRA